MKTCQLRLGVEYNEKKTNPEALAEAYDRLLGTAITTPGILDEYGEVDTGEFFVDLDPPTTFEAVALLRSALAFVTSESACSSNEYKECEKLHTEIVAHLAAYDHAHPHRCQDCGRQWTDDEIIPLSDIQHLLERVAPGEPMPSGECPTCGALCQPLKVD
jgi:hypothetical protein